jgi:hypothetical protein
MTRKCPKEANLELGTVESDLVVAFAIDSEPMAEGGHFQFRAHDHPFLLNARFRCIVVLPGDRTWNLPVAQSNTNNGHDCLGCDDRSIAV